MIKIDVKTLMADYSALQKTLVPDEDGRRYPLYEAPSDCIRVVLRTDSAQAVEILKDLKFATLPDRLWEEMLHRDLRLKDKTGEFSTLKGNLASARKAADFHLLRREFEKGVESSGGLRPRLYNEHYPSDQVDGWLHLLFPDVLMQRLGSMAYDRTRNCPSPYDVAFASLYLEAFEKVTRIEVQQNGGYYFPGNEFENKVKDLQSRIMASPLFYHDVKILPSGEVFVDGYLCEDTNCCKVLLALAFLCPDPNDLVVERDAFMKAFGGHTIEANKTFPNVMDRARERCIPFLRYSPLEKLKRVSGVVFSEVSLEDHDIRDRIASLSRKR